MEQYTDDTKHVSLVCQMLDTLNLISGCLCHLWSFTLNGDLRKHLFNILSSRLQSKGLELG